MTLLQLNDYLMQERWTPHYYDIPFTIRTATSRIECEDGFNVSVQAGEHHYSKPRSNDGPWTEFECGFPTANVPEWQERMDGDQYDDHTKAVFGYVAAKDVLTVLMQHGGPTEEWMDKNLFSLPVEYTPLSKEQEAECRLGSRVHMTLTEYDQYCGKIVALVERSAGFLLFCPEHKWVEFSATEAARD